MMIASSAIVAILARRPGWEALLARIDGARDPLMTTPVALLEAVAALKAVKGRDGASTPALLAAARATVAEFAAALALREVPVTAELGRRAQALLVGGDASPEDALSAAAARAYRVPCLGWD